MAIQDKFNKPNVIYKITKDIDLEGNTLTIPAGCTLDFQGGSFTNGTIVGNNTKIKAGLQKIFNMDITLNGTWDVLESYPEWFGAKRDGITDDTDAIIQCLKLNNVLLSIGTYIVSPKYIDTLRNRHYCFELSSNLNIRGESKYETVLKAKDNISSVNNSINYNMFYAINDLKDICISNITFDMNGRNNLIAIKPSEEQSAVYGLKSTSAILINLAGGVEENKIVENLYISNCVFKGTPGTNNIIISNGVYDDIVADRKCRNIIIEFCDIVESGFNTSDYTSIFITAEDSIVRNCKFFGDSNPDSQITGVTVEFHGSNNRYYENLVEGFTSGVLFGPFPNLPVSGFYCYNNSFKVRYQGVRVWTDLTTDGISDVYIHDNYVEIIEGQTLNDIFFGAINTDCAKNQSNIYIINNILVCKANKEGSGIHLGSYYDDIINDNYLIQGNNIKGFRTGISVGFKTINTGIATNVVIKDNFIVSPLVGIHFFTQNEKYVHDYIYIISNNINATTCLEFNCNMGYVEIMNNNYLNLESTFYSLKENATFRRLYINESYIREIYDYTINIDYFYNNYLVSSGLNSRDIILCDTLPFYRKTINISIQQKTNSSFNIKNKEGKILYTLNKFNPSVSLTVLNYGKWRIFNCSTTESIGTTGERPTLKSTDEGFEYYDSTLKKKILWNGSKWTNLDGTPLV